VLTLLAGFASAQVNTGVPQLTCATQVAVTPLLRGEGYTEMTGDITISCTGGTQGPAGSSIPLVNIAVFYNTIVTSRLIGTTTNAFLPNEALLLLDEPGSGLGGDGPARAQKLCTTPITGCAATVGSLPSIAGGTIAAAIGADGTYAPNVYQGTSSSTTGNVVTFFGVPVLAPGTNGARVFRITDVRVNANSLSGGAASTGAGSQVTATVTVSGAASLGIPPGVINVGLVNNGLAASTGTAGTINQCATFTKSSASTISFTENFGTSFKTRVSALATTNPTGLYAGQAGNPTQNLPGGIYNSESNFVFPIGTQFAGLADYGTRLKATFSNVPSGARIFVSTNNVNNNASPISTPFGGGPAGGSAGNVNPASGVPYVGFAQLVNGETSPDGNLTGFFPAITSTDTATSGNVPIAEVSLSNNTGSAVWEVVNTDPNTAETFKFAVYVTSSANSLPAGSPPTVTLSFAPTATSAVASSTLTIPRFTGGTTTGSIFTVNICRTILLYPYLTNQAGFDTGVTVANTTTDPFGTAAQAGSCKLNWYGGTTAAPTVPPVQGDTGNIATGTVWANTLQAIAPNFQGYMIAVCNFQFAHGFAFISDVGARNLAMGYLAVVLNDPGTGSRSNANTTTSENGGH
jgi:hypothetical protein